MISTKAEMYQLLAAGELGNTVPQYFSVAEWWSHRSMSELWGIRSPLAGGGYSKLNVPVADVPLEVVTNFKSGRANISPMVDHMATLRGQLWDSPHGLYLQYVRGNYGAKDVPAGQHPWRWLFNNRAQDAWNTSARLILETHLLPGDYEDVQTLLERFPGHVIEFSTCDRTVGVVPMRNTVIWEVRNY